MDGSAALGLVLPRDTNRKYLDFISQPMAPLIGIALAWVVFPRLFTPAFWSTIDLVYSGIAVYH